MANKVISMQQIRSIIQLLEKGYSLRAISVQIGLSRQTVTFYVARLKNAPYSLEALHQLPDEDLASIVYAPVVVKSLPWNARRQELDVRMPYFLSKLKRTGVTRLLLWEEYRKESNDPFRYTQFCILLKQASKITNASMHLVHAPGAMVMVDFAGDKMSYVDRSTGEVFDELKKGNDDLFDWAKNELHNEFFFDTDNSEDMLKKYQELMLWSQQNNQYTDNAKEEFAEYDNADAWIIALAIDNNLTVVSQEVYDATIKRKIPIPNVCTDFNVRHINTFTFLRECNFKM